MPQIALPDGWTIGKRLAVGGTAVVCELAGPAPAIVKWARYRDRDIKGRFAIEAEILKTVGAPTTPSLIEHGMSGEWPYLIMEHVTGETLAEWMSRNGDRGGLGEIIAILTRVSIALGTLHDAGYVHRDLKPENIIIGSRGVRLLDFGLAKPARHETGLTQIGSVVGTTHYIAPEQIRMGGAVDSRADIYSLGVIAYEMLAGMPPFIGERRAIEYQHQVGRPPSVRESRDVPKELDELLLSCLSKQPDARPQSAPAFRDALGKAVTPAGTLRGTGGRQTTSSSPMSPLGKQSEVALAWIVGGDPIAVTRAITAVHGIVVRQRGDGILAAFSATHHEAPLDIAFTTCSDLRDRCSIVLHMCSALVRHSAQNKPMVYGQEIEHVEAWCPAAPFVGLVFTASAAQASKRALVPASGIAGFFRDGTRLGTADGAVEPAFVGRIGLVDRIVSAIGSAPVLVGISGDEGSGKSRTLAMIVAKLRGREVIELRARRRFLGDVPDDVRLMQMLGDVDPAQALVAAARRRAVLVVDDVDRLSSAMVGILLRDGLPLARVLTSRRPLFEVTANVVSDRVAIELPRLASEDASVLLRDQLRPARLIPDVLIERLALRGIGNPRLLLALARDMKARGAIRRDPGSDEWYVAADELDTLLAAPGPSWVALRALDDIPAAVAAVMRACCALGPRFSGDEVANVVPDAAEHLAFLVRAGMLVERSGWYEVEDASLQDAIYEHVLEERESLHARALDYWLARPNANYVGWLARVAYHMIGAQRLDAGAACMLALARAAARRGERDQAQLLNARASACLSTRLPQTVREAMIAIEED